MTVLLIALMALAPSVPRGYGYDEALAFRAAERREVAAELAAQRDALADKRLIAAYSRYGYRVARWAPLVAEFFPRSQLGNALYCISRESGGDPNAHNPSGATGLFQLVGYPFNVFPPRVNVHMAYHLWRARGWSPWSVM